MKERAAPTTAAKEKVKENRKAQKGV